MAAIPDESFLCAGCGQRLPWIRQQAGRSLLCRCGQRLVVPAAPEAANAAGIVPVLPAPDVPLSRRRSGPRVLSYEPLAPKRSWSLADLLGNLRRDLFWPGGLIVVSIVFYVVRWVILVHDFWEGVGLAAFSIAVNAVAATVVMLVMSRVVDLDWGLALGASLRTLALGLFPNAAAGMLHLLPDDAAAGMLSLFPAGWLYAVVVSFALYAVLFKLFFNVGLIEGAMCVILTWLLVGIAWVANGAFMWWLRW